MKKLFLFLLVAALVLAGCGGGSAQPKPGATFSGPIEISADKAESANLFFTVSDDGTAITKIGISFTNFKCEVMSAGSMSLNSGGNFPITNGLDLSPSNIGQIKGKFNSPTKASGTIDIKLEINTGFGTATCELGTFKWSAEAK